MPDLPDEVAAALASGNAIVCYTKCWSCQFRQCMEPPKWHTWADDEDIAHAAATGRPTRRNHDAAARALSSPTRRSPMPDQPDPSVLGAVLDVSAVLTRMLASMVTCPTCGVLPPRPCFADGSVHPLRISTEETTR